MIKATLSVSRDVQLLYHHGFYLKQIMQYLDDWEDLILFPEFTQPASFCQKETESAEGKTPAIGNHQARALCVADIQERSGVKHLQVRGKGSKIRYVPLHPGAAAAIVAYLEAAGRGDDANRALFRPTSNNARSRTASITPDGVYKMLTSYAKALQIDVAGFGPHALRATAATNALDNGADIAKIQEWLGV
jgi:hypothetical protein